MHMLRFKRVGKRILQIGLLILVVVFFLYYVKAEWGLLTVHAFQWNPWLLLLAFAGFLLQEVSYGLIWRAVLARLGQQLALRTCLRIYLASEFVRYIPGNVWHVLARILWVGKHGVSRPVAFASMTVELITKLAAGAFIFACSLLFWGGIGTVRTLLYGKPLVVGLSVVIMLALFVGLHPRVLNKILNVGLHLLKREPIVLTLCYSDIMLVSLAWCASWVVAGCAFYVLVLAVWPTLPLAALPICVGIYAIGWDIGFVSFITPGGLGFREGAIAGLLALSLPFLAVGPIVAILSRLVSTLAELVCVSIAYLSGGQQMRVVQQEQASQLPVTHDGVEGKAIDTPLSTTQIRIEGGGIRE